MCDLHPENTLKITPTMEVPLMTNSSQQPPEIERAWRYYQHADTIQHQRHGFFMVAHAMLFAAYAQRVEPWSVVYALLGAIFAGVWYLSAERLSDGMSALSTRYLASSTETQSDPVYVHYLSSLRRIGGASGRTLMNVVIPWLIVFAWVVLGVKAVCTR